MNLTTHFHLVPRCLQARTGKTLPYYPSLAVMGISNGTSAQQNTYTPAAICQPTKRYSCARYTDTELHRSYRFPNSVTESKWPMMSGTIFNIIWNSDNSWWNSEYIRREKRKREKIQGKERESEMVTYNWIMLSCKWLPFALLQVKLQTVHSS
jgi:hypothetical protein